MRLVQGEVRQGRETPMRPRDRCSASRRHEPGGRALPRAAPWAAPPRTAARASSTRTARAVGARMHGGRRSAVGCPTGRAPLATTLAAWTRRTCRCARSLGRALPRCAVSRLTGPYDGPRRCTANAARGATVLVDSSGCVVDAGSRLVALVGVQNLVVVDTPDALLVCPKERAQDVRLIVEELRRRKLQRYL